MLQRYNIRQKALIRRAFEKEKLYLKTFDSFKGWHFTKIKTLEALDLCIQLNSIIIKQSTLLNLKNL